jgi:hypothetical protein
MDNFEVNLGGRSIPRLMIGTSPFMGAGQFREKADGYRRRFCEHPENMTELFAYFVQKGLRGAHLCLLEPIARAAMDAYEKVGFRFPVLVTLMPDNWDLQWEWIARLDTVAVFLHAHYADQAPRTLIREFIRKTRNLGLIPGVSTHEGGFTIPMLDRMNLDLGAYLVAFNKKGLHVHPDLPSTLRAISSTDKFLVGMKTLGAGALRPAEALPFVLERVHAVTMGLTEKEEIDQAFEALKECRFLKNPPAA